MIVKEGERVKKNERKWRTRVGYGGDWFYSDSAL